MSQKESYLSENKPPTGNNHNHDEPAAKARRVELTILALVEQIHRDSREIQLRSGSALDMLRRIQDGDGKDDSESTSDPATFRTVQSLKRDTAMGTLLMAADQVDRMASLFHSILALHRSHT